MTTEAKRVPQVGDTWMDCDAEVTLYAPLNWATKAWRTCQEGAIEGDGFVHTGDDCCWRYDGPLREWGTFVRGPAPAAPARCGERAGDWACDLGAGHVGFYAQSSSPLAAPPVAVPVIREPGKLPVTRVSYPKVSALLKESGSGIAALKLPAPRERWICPVSDEDLLPDVDSRGWRR